ncbi:hypothetical protein [Mitsuokella multacida]|uniref:hypothetical protein n=1 Tax=Mitsuokella multacida TaxID=52226 RepID=UPI0026DAD506|nr:hypothetical protein [Mitsuokella multacida]
MKQLRRRGVILSFEMAIVAVLVVILAGIGIGLGSYSVNEYRAYVARTQASTIDTKLLAYAKAHATADTGTIKKDGHTNYALNYEQKLVYPLVLDNMGVLGEASKGSVNKGFLGYFDPTIEFTDSPQSDFYKFHYIPLDENGNVVSVSSSTPVTHYTLEVYVKSGTGEVMRYASPRSYEHLPDDAK